MMGTVVSGALRTRRRLFVLQRRCRVKSHGRPNKKTELFHRAHGGVGGQVLPRRQA